MTGFRIFVIFCLLAWQEKTSAQTGGLSGVITTDAHEPATVFLLHTSYGSMSDSSGHYIIQNIPAGNYTVQISCLGYITLLKPVSVDSSYQQLDAVLETDKLLEEVVITGVSHATLIREDPAAITVITPKAIEQSNENNIIDVLARHAPGLSTVKTGPNISKPFIRGLGYNRVLTQYDGIRQEGQQWGDEHGIEVDDYAIERAEVLKGPASLMYGSDALAGAVSLFPYIPNEKDAKLHGKWTSEYQSNNNLAGSGLQLGYSNSHLVAAIRGSYRLAKNYSNAIDGRVYNTGFDEKNFSALLGYQNTKGFSHFNVTLYDNLQGIPDGSRDSLNRRFTYQVYEGNEDSIKKRPLVSNSALNSYKLSPLHQHIQHYRAYMHHAYGLTKGDVDVLLALQQNVRREYNHPTLPEQAGLYLRLNTLNYSLRYNAPKFAGIEVSAGLNGMRQNNKSLDATDFPIPDYQLLDAGVYAHAKWKYQRVTLSGGLRYDVRTIQWSNFYLENNPATGFDQHVDANDTSSANLQFAAFKKTVRGLSAGIGGTYRLNSFIHLKANVARGYRAPAITELASNGLDPGAHIIYLGNRNFVPEFSLQEDLGLQIDYNSISVSVSAFNNFIRNYSYLSLSVDAHANPIVDAQGNKTYRYQQATAQLYGLEGNISFHPQHWKGFKAEGSLAWLQAFNRSAQFQHKGVQGEYLSLIPPLKLNGSIAQIVRLKTGRIKSCTPTIAVDYNAAQRHFLALNNTESFTPAYALFSLSLATEIRYLKNNTMQLQLQVNNVFDSVYQSNLSRLKYFEYYAASSNSYRGIYNMGRNFCVKLIVPVV